MARLHHRRITRLVAMTGVSAMIVACSATASTASTTTYKVGGVQFKAAFPSKATSTSASELFSGMPGLGSATVVAPSATAIEVFDDVWKPNEFAVEVITYKSASASRSYFQAFGSGGPFKKETFDGRAAYDVVGNTASTFLNAGTPIKNATGGLDWVLDGTSIIEAWSVTTTAAMSRSFLDSLKILS